jgi:hypothetical protein
MKSVKLFRTVLLLLPTLAFLHACGGSSGSSSPTPTATITGSVYAAPVAGATVVVLNSSGTTTIAGPVKTLSDGTYSVSIPTALLASDLIFSSNSGTYTDEATGIQTPAGTMAAYVEADTLTAGSKVTLDPSSTISHELMTAHGKTAAAAKTAFGNGFGFMPDASVVPELCTSPLSGTNAAPRLRGLVAAALSQLTQDLGLAPEQQFDLFAALAEDISDGKLDGMNGVSPVTVPGTAVVVPTNILTRYYQAVDNASRTTFTSTYKVEYLPGMMAAAQGKTTFKIKITKRSDSSAAPGLTLSLMPMMHMLTMNHATPVDNIVDNGDGTYSCTVYYLMPSVMSGMAMGCWELKVMIGSGMTGEATTFYPNVGMAMGDTVSASLYGPSDIINVTTGTDNRKYYLFKESIISAATPTLNLYIAHDEGMKMSFKPAFNGAILSDPNGTITSMSVRASTDKINWSTSNVDNANGHWSLSGISGLASGVTTTIYVELIVNTEQKTTSGAAPSGTNDYASFQVTPQL